MSKREPLLSDMEVRGSCSDDLDMDPIHVRDHYEATWGQLIQQLVDALHKCTVEQPSVDGAFVFATIDAAAAQGFTPTP